MSLRLDPTRLAPVVGAALPVGLVAGLGSALLLTVVGEPLVRAAIAIEEATAATAPASAEPELVARSVQSGVGLFAALGLAGAAFGLLFGLAYWALRHTQPHPFRRALFTGALLFGSFSVAPWLKYPPNPPAVGDPATLGRRQGLYVSLIALSLALGLCATALAGCLRRRGWPEHRRVAAVTAAVALAFGAAFALLPPAPDAVAVPATLIWRFRLASLGGNAVLWGLLSVGFGLVVAEGRRSPRTPALADVSS